MDIDGALLLSGQPLRADQIAQVLESGSDALDRYLGNQIYFNTAPVYLRNVRTRLAATARLHAQKVGDKPTLLLRAPGRLNAFLEYLDMCAGDHMSTTIDGDLPACVSVREDNQVRLYNCREEFPDDAFSIPDELDLFRSAPWEGQDCEGIEDNWDNRSRVYPYYGRPCGAWVNYVLSPFLRVGWDLPDVALRGVDITFGESTIPMRAGTSSSSAVVVLSFLALYLANADSLPNWSMEQICTMLGEAEWYVGTHGGANDHATILRCFPNGILYNRHSQPEPSSTPLPSLCGVKMIVANSLWEASKSLSANHVFNLRKGWMDLGDELMRLIIGSVGRRLDSGTALEPGWIAGALKDRFGFEVDSDPAVLESDLDLWQNTRRNYRKFGSLDEHLLEVPRQAVEELIGLLPAELSALETARILNKDLRALERDYVLPYPDEGGYRPRAAALFFYKENTIGRELERILTEADRRLAAGEITVDSQDYARYQRHVGWLLEELQVTLREDFQVSNSQLDMLLEIAKSAPGYLGGKLTGAGCGGCVTIMVREGDERAFCDHLDQHYYSDKRNFDCYRETIAALDPDAARELADNLGAALGNIRAQRRVITFSAGAGAVDVAGSAESVRHAPACNLGADVERARPFE